MNLLLIAPVAPFRGGIARYSEALARAFTDDPDVDVEVESFARLYPRLIYPGASDRDGADNSARSLRRHYALDTLNPLTWHAAVKRIAAHSNAVAIIPAWTFFVAPMFGWIARRLHRRGIPVVMIVHNATDHEGSSWKSRLLDWQLGAADCFLVHTEAVAGQLREAGHRQPIAVSRLPSGSDLPIATGVLPREHALELLCFGLVRRYKGVDIALRALAAADLGDVRLTIAGEIWEDAVELRRLAEQADHRAKIEIIDRYVSDTEAAELFVRCDAVLAPYRSVTGSGVVALARHYRKPVIASDLAGLREVIEPGKTGWFFRPENDAALAELLRNQVTRQTAAAMQGDLDQAANKDGWQGYCQSIRDLIGQARRANA